jgi:hypothetical protein
LGHSFEGKYIIIRHYFQLIVIKGFKLNRNQLASVDTEKINFATLMQIFNKDCKEWENLYFKYLSAAINRPAAIVSIVVELSRPV